MKTTTMTDPKAWRRRLRRMRPARRAWRAQWLRERAAERYAALLGPR